MDDGIAQLAEMIAADLATWETPHVELAIYGTSDARVIAAEVARFCRDELGGVVARGLFHTASIGAVTAVELRDGRRVVVKAHQPERELAWLQEIVRTQMHLASRGLYATTVCGGPAPIGRGLAIVEAFVERGVLRDAHEPAVRAALAQSLWEIVAACRPLVAGSSLRPQLLGVPAGALWPTPHSKLFDFSQPVAWIDEVARAARARFVEVGEVVIGHGDWRAEHVRFEGERVAAAFDWDSLCKEREPALVGFAAHAFCADWSRTPPPAPPTLDEARAFVAEYERARGRAFAADERRLCGAAFAYACAYTARCSWSLDAKVHPDTFGDRVQTHGVRLLDL
jgi:hypothetical protein